MKAVLQRRAALVPARLMTFAEFQKLMRSLGIKPRYARRIWNILTFELSQLGGAFPVSDDERVVEVGALRAYLAPTRRLKRLTGIGKKSEQALRRLAERL